MTSLGQQKNRRSSRTGARRVDRRCCPTNTRRRTCPRELEGLGHRRLKHGGCQHQSEAWWRRYQTFLLTSRAPSEKKSGGDFPTRTLSVGYGRASETSATCTGCRRKPWRTSCRKLAGQRLSSRRTRCLRAVDCGHIASTRRRIDKLKQSPVQIGEVGKSGTP